MNCTLLLFLLLLLLCILEAKRSKFSKSDEILKEEQQQQSLPSHSAKNNAKYKVSWSFTIVLLTELMRIHF